MKIRQKMIKFMQGRYGPDNLYTFFFKLYLLLFIVNLFVKSKIINLFLLLIVFIILYRFFSKKIYKRANENQVFLKIKKKLISPFSNIKRNIQDKNHVYKKCHKCKTILKLPLPSKKGFRKAKCPNCGNKVKLFTFKREKIEIITDKSKLKKYESII